MAYDPGSANLLETLTGQNKGHVTPNLIQGLPDDVDQGTYASAMADYQQRLAAYQEAQKNFKGAFGGVANLSPEEYRRQGAILQAGAPQLPDLNAIQAQSDRRRLLNLALSAYQPAISDLLSASRGEGPSAALNAYHEAADDAARRNYGLAASARGTGGQRAALFQAAIGQEAIDRQKAANRAAAIGAEEQQKARASLNETLGGLVNVYGNQLYTGTQTAQGRNQNAQNLADDANREIAEGNATRAQKSTQAGFETVGTFTGGL